MKRERTSVVLLAVMAFGPFALLPSCGDTNEASNQVGDAAPADVGSSPDAGNDAEERHDANVDSDAALPSCSTGGFCWTEVPSEKSLRAVWGDGQGVVWTVSAEGDVLSWDGTSWSVRFTAPGALFAVWGSGPTDIWVGGVDGLFHGTGSTPTTLSWAAVDALPGDAKVPILSIWGRTADDVWAVGSKDEYDPGSGHFGATRILHLAKVADTGSASWSLDTLSSDSVFASSGRGLAILDVWGNASGDVWLAGRTYGGKDVPFLNNTLAVVFHRSRAAADWSETGLVSGDPDELAKVNLYAGTPAGEGALIGVLKEVAAGGAISRRLTVARRDSWTDAGPSVWSELPPLPEWTAINPNNLYPNTLWATNANDVWYAARYAVLHFDGAKWETAVVARTPTPINTVYWAVWSSGPGDVWIVGDGIAVHKGPL